MRRIFLVTGLALMATTAHAQGHRFTPGSDTSTWVGISG